MNLISVGNLHSKNILDAVIDEPVGEPSVSQEIANRSGVEQKSSTWADRLRRPRKLAEPSHTLSDIRTPA